MNPNLFFVLSKYEPSQQTLDPDTSTPSSKENFWQKEFLIVSKIQKSCEMSRERKRCTILSKMLHIVLMPDPSFLYYQDTSFEDGNNDFTSERCCTIVSCGNCRMHDFTCWDFGNNPLIWCWYARKFPYFQTFDCSLVFGSKWCIQNSSTMTILSRKSSTTNCRSKFWQSCIVAARLFVRIRGTHWDETPLVSRCSTKIYEVIATDGNVQH